jgi:hypothetical protein
MLTTKSETAYRLWPAGEVEFHRPSRLVPSRQKGLHGHLRVALPFSGKFPAPPLSRDNQLFRSVVSSIRIEAAKSRVALERPDKPSPA